MTSEGLFKKYGFQYQVFNPYGVTEDISMPVPIPVGDAKKVITKILPEIDRTLQYTSNMIIPIVGDYGSGKTELMNFIFRYLQDNKQSKKSIQVLKFHRYSPDSRFNLLNFLKDSIKDIDLKTNKHHYVFIDEIDDIPRDISRNLLSTEDANKFFRHLRRFLEASNDPVFKKYKKVTLILGFGSHSFAYLSEQNPDLVKTGGRLAASIIKLKEAEPWVATGMLARHLYFFSSEDFYHRFLESNPYFPFSEGVAKAIARLSAIASPNKTLNMRFITQIFDRLLYWSLKHGELNKKNNYWVPKEITPEIVYKFLINPSDFAQFDEDIIKSLKKMSDSFMNTVNELIKYSTISEDQAREILCEIIFNHMPLVTNDFVEKFNLNLGQVKNIIDILLNSAYIQKRYLFKINYDKLTEIKKDIFRRNKGVKFHDKFYYNIFTRLYNFRIDENLGKFEHKMDYSKLKKIDNEYYEILTIEEKMYKDLIKVLPSLKNIDNEKQEAYLVNESFWKDIIREGSLSTLEKSKFFDIQENYELLSIKDFQSKIKSNIEKNTQIIRIHDDCYKYGILMNQPKILILGVKQTKKIPLIEGINNIITNYERTKDESPIEGMIFVVEESPIYNLEKIQNELSEDFIDFKEFWLKERTRFLFINKEKLCAITYFDQIMKDQKLTKKYSNVMREFSSQISQINDELLEIWSKKGLIPASHKVDRIKVDRILPAIIRLLELRTETSLDISLLLNTRNQKKFYKEYVKINSFDELITILGSIDRKFVFKENDLISKCDTDILKCLFSSTNTLKYEHSVSLLSQYFILSKSHMTAEDLLNILVVKGLININVKKKKTFSTIELISKEILEKNLNDKLKQVDETKRKLDNLKVKIELGDKTVLFNIAALTDFNKEFNIDKIQTDCFELIENYREVDFSLGVSNKDLTQNALVYHKFIQKLNKLKDANEKLTSVEGDFNSLDDNLQGLLSIYIEKSSELQPSHRGEVNKQIENKLILLERRKSLILSDINELNFFIEERTRHIDHIIQGYEKKEGIIKNFETELQKYNTKIDKIADLPENIATYLEFIEKHVTDEITLDSLVELIKEEFTSISLEDIESELILFDDLMKASDYYSWAETIISKTYNNIGDFETIIDPIILDEFTKLQNWSEWLLNKTANLKLSKISQEEIKIIIGRLEKDSKYDGLVFSSSGIQNYNEAINKCIEIRKGLNEITKKYITDDEIFDLTLFIAQMGLDQVIGIQTIVKDFPNVEILLDKLAKKGLIIKRWVTS